MEREILPVTDEAVAVTWTKALGTLHGSRLDSVGAESAFMMAHQAALQGSLAVLRAAGQRVVGRNQSEDLFSRVTALDAGELSRAARAVDRLRRVTREVLYGPARVDAATLAEMQAAAERLLAAAHAWLREARPALMLTPPGTRRTRQRPADHEGRRA